MLRQIGKGAFIFREGEDALPQSIMVLDNQSSEIAHQLKGLRRIQDYFPCAELIVLTFPEREAALRQELPLCNYKVVSPLKGFGRYAMFFEILSLKKKRTVCIVLSGLDITPLIAALFFLKTKVILYNRWGEWWEVRRKIVSDLFKDHYQSKSITLNLKSLFKLVGSFFVYLERRDERVLSFSFLLVDNGYTIAEQLHAAAQRIRLWYPYSRVSALLPMHRISLTNNIEGADFLYVPDFLIRKYSVARQMLRLRRKSYDYTVLFSLDESTLGVASLFFKSRLLFYNKYGQWWSISHKSLWQHAWSFFSFLLNCLLFFYLYIFVRCIFLKRILNLSFAFNMQGVRKNVS